MTLTEEDLSRKAKKRELKALQKNTLIPERVASLEGILHDVYVICRPKQSDYHHRKNLIRVFNEIAKEIYGKNSDHPVVVEFGSFTMDIFSPTSDLDLSINFTSNSAECPRELKIKTLRKFAKKFYGFLSKGHVSNVQPIMTANVPIVKVTDAGTGIECDLSVENRDGILKSQIVHMISSIDERFQKLSFLMKGWAKAHNINSSKDHTLNSLSIVLLVAFHLQTRDPPILPPFSVILKDGADHDTVSKLVKQFVGYGKNNKETLAELFVTLLTKLTSVEKLWPRGLCASTYQGVWTTRTWNSKVACISVEDFTDRSQNVAKAVAKDQVKKINNCIKLSLQYLTSFMEGRIQRPGLRDFLFGRDYYIAAATIKQVGGHHLTHNNPPHNDSNNHIISKKRRRVATITEEEESRQQGWGRMSGGRSWGGAISSAQVWATAGGGPPLTTTHHHGWGSSLANNAWGSSLANNAWGGTLQATVHRHHQGWGGTTPSSSFQQQQQQTVVGWAGRDWRVQQSPEAFSSGSNYNSNTNWGTWNQGNYNNSAPPPPPSRYRHYPN